METPDTINNFIKPLLLTQSVDEKRLPPNLSRQFSSIVNHFQNKAGNLILLNGPSNEINAFAASLMGKRVDRDVYRVDLLATASKHIGDTEKNLLQVFDFAEQHHFVLFFDEADSLFKKRSGTDPDNDRYANLDVNYLLRRIEAYPGIVLLSSNSPENMDKALLKAAHWQVDLHHPVTPEHLSFWQRLLRRLGKR